jgi:hypothetical protein
MIQISIDTDMYNRIVEAIKPLEKSEESVFKSAVNNTAKKAQKKLAQQAKSIYGGGAPKGILGRSSIDKASVKNTSVQILFRSEQHRLNSFRVNKAGMTTAPIWKNGKRKKITVRAAQLKKGRLKALSNAFSINAPNGKDLLVVRIGGGKTKGHKANEWGYDKVKALMGSSDKVMVQNEKVYGAVSDDIGELLQQECQKALDKALEKGK